MDLQGVPVLAWVLHAARCAPGVDEVWVATSTLEADNIIEQWCKKNKVLCFRGSETDVLSRYVGAAKTSEADIVLRVTSDCPFLDPTVIGEVIRLRQMTVADYVSNQWPPTYPDGLDVECFTKEALFISDAEATLQSDRDCVTQFIERNHHRFKTEALICPLPGLVKERWVLDTSEDLAFCRAVASHITKEPPFLLDILQILDEHPEYRELNGHLKRNERFYDALAVEPIQKRTYVNSGNLLERAKKIIPLAAQTFSKSYLQFPEGRLPQFLTHGDGAYVFDVSGNRYIDLISGLLPNILGYRDPDVDAAIRRQLSSGISFSLATVLESELSERLVKHIPCAEMVRFGKTGTDVTTAAVKLARHATNKHRVLLFNGGYHGWNDWPLTTRVNINDSETLHKVLREKDFACVMIEPEQASQEFLTYLRALTASHGIVLIFDEIISGFRFHMGGIGAMSGVKPDLACFGKSMGNGMPISALVGKRDLMKEFDKCFFSGTYFGETLSIAAAIATIDKIERESVIPYLWEAGGYLVTELTKLLKKFGPPFPIGTYGRYPQIKLDFMAVMGATKEQIRTLFQQEMAQAGVLIANCHGISFAHREPELKRILFAYEHTLGVLYESLKVGDIAKRLEGNAVIPLVREAAQ